VYMIRKARISSSGSRPSYRTAPVRSVVVGVVATRILLVVWGVALAGADDPLADILVGVAGAFIGGYILAAIFGADTTVGFWGSIVVAFVGAAALLAALKLLSGGRL